MKTMEEFEVVSPKPQNLRLKVRLHPPDTEYQQLYQSENGQLINQHRQELKQSRNDPDLYIIVENGQTIKAKSRIITTSYIEFVLENLHVGLTYTATYTHAEVFPDMVKLYDELEKKLKNLWTNEDKDCGLSIEENNEEFDIKFVGKFLKRPEQIEKEVKLHIKLTEQPLSIDNKLAIFKKLVVKQSNEYEQFKNAKHQYDQYENKIEQVEKKYTNLEQKLEQQAQQIEILQQANRSKDERIDSLEKRMNELQTTNASTMFYHFMQIQEEFNKSTKIMNQEVLDKIILDNQKLNAKEAETAQKITNLGDQLLELKDQVTGKLTTAYQAQQVTINDLNSKIISVQASLFRENEKLQTNVTQKTLQVDEFAQRLELLESSHYRENEKLQTIMPTLQETTIILTKLNMQQWNIEAHDFFMSQAFEFTTATKFIIKNLEEGAQITLGVCDGNIPLDDYLLEDSETYKLYIPDGQMQRSSLAPKQLVNHLFQIKDQIILKVTIGLNNDNVITIVINDGQKYNIGFSGSRFRFFMIATDYNAGEFVQ